MSQEQFEYFKKRQLWMDRSRVVFWYFKSFIKSVPLEVYARTDGVQPKFANSILAVLIGYFVNLAMPRAGEVSRATVMVNYENIPFEKGFGTIVAERIADLIMMFIIIGITFFFNLTLS